MITSPGRSRLFLLALCAAANVAFAQPPSDRAAVPKPKTYMPERVQAAVKEVVDRWGRLDFVCANAGTNGTWAPIDKLTPDDWSETIAINLTGTYLTIHHAVPYLRAAGGGSIVIDLNRSSRQA